MSLERRWYVIYCRSRFEKKLFRTLVSKGINVYFPTRGEIRQWHDRKKKVEVPVFPNYIFVQVNLYEMIHVYGSPGFLKFVTTENEPDVISDSKMALIRKLLSSDFEVTAESFSKGERVRVLDGPFEGLEGELIGHRADCRLSVKVDVINKYVTLLIPPSQVEKVGLGRSVA